MHYVKGLLLSAVLIEIRTTAARWFIITCVQKKVTDKLSSSLWNRGTSDCYKDLFIKIRTRTVVKLLLILYEFL